jgi:crotonobetainyl-CoA:carnitine CoA-transferase CaiB-like acyl-CoA transferase
MGREDLRDDWRYVDNRGSGRQSRGDRRSGRGVDAHARHMHERGMLEWIEHDEIGRIVVPTTPLRIHGADPIDTVPSPKLDQHNREIYGDWLGLSHAETAALEQDSVI